MQRPSPLRVFFDEVWRVSKNYLLAAVLAWLVKEAIVNSVRFDALEKQLATLQKRTDARKQPIVVSVFVSPELLQTAKILPNWTASGIRASVRRGEVER